MPKPNDLHHLAITTADIKQQIEYFSTVLGMELVALYWMHGVDQTVHAFLRLGDSSSIALVQNPQIGEIKPQMGVSHPSWTAANVPPPPGSAEASPSAGAACRAAPASSGSN